MTEHGTGGSHYGRLEIDREVMNSLTKVSKDTLVIEVNELDTTRPESDERRDSTPQTPQCRGGGENSDDRSCDGIQEPSFSF